MGRGAEVGAFLGAGEAVLEGGAVAVALLAVEMVVVLGEGAEALEEEVADLVVEDDNIQEARMSSRLFLLNYIRYESFIYPAIDSRSR